ncbi:MAG TPA: tetratricopeptide repeat protein [bacterium]|nr:tetratricopeptide repeat protein [bacterium]
MPSLPTGTVTFLFTDIEGSTRLLEQLGDRYAKVLAEYRRLVRTTAYTKGGRDVDTQGDGCFLAFPRAKDALSAAVAALHAIKRFPWPAGISVRVRMGLHTGEPVSGNGGYVGMAVHRASRICAVGHGGQILLSQTTRDLVADDPPKGVNFRDLGQHRLKDLGDPQHLFQVVTASLPADFPPLNSLDALPNNLPRQVASFVGRTLEIIEVKRLLTTTCLLTLTGAGGSGKTRLALQVAADLLELYPDGAWMVDLAPLSDPTLVPLAAVSALGVSEQPTRSLIETLADYLRSKSLLLILDNCEHLLSTSAQLADTLLRTCPKLRILATSREGLRIAGEMTYTVPSLSLPDPRVLPSPRDLMQFEAVRLFAERAAFGKPGFQVTSGNAAAVAHICHRLDGIPLAIELAAARVKAMPLETIALRLDDRFRLLTGGSRTALPRQQTLRGAMDWSYELLSELERSLLRQLSVFVGGFTLEAAERVCGDGGGDRGDILNLLTNLVNKSLVGFDEQQGGGRYRLLETMRQYSWDRLVASGEEHHVRGRHRDYFLGLAEQAELKFRGPDQGAWNKRLETEYDNVRAAVSWSMTEGTLEVGLRLASSLYWLWDIRGLREGGEWLDAMLAQATDTSPAVRARALNAAAFVAHRQGRPDRILERCREALNLCRALGDEHGSAWALHYLAHAAELQGDYAEAGVKMEESVALCRRTGNTWYLPVSLNCLGEIVRLQGDYERATVLSEESLSIARKLGDTRGVASALANAGVVLALQGNYQRAEAMLKEGLALFCELGVKLRTSHCLLALARTAHGRGQNERAARLFGAVAALRESTGIGPAPSDLAEDDRAVTALRAAMGDVAFAAAWAEGRGMTPERVIEVALTSEDIVPSKTKSLEKPISHGQLDRLSLREREVAVLVARGLTNREIASQLTVTVRTAETHVQNVLNKLGLNSRAQIAAWAVEQGLYTPSPS